MVEYQVIARKYRPQFFQQVIGQEAIVTTLKNALKFSRLSHAYLFCGSKGTGKTTVARIFAKALNCHSLDENQEPCNHCASCKEINSGSSLDVLEIDGASHRGIEDIRQINETIAYAPQSGKYKIYLIDEVHMLTKEAFNALLKTVEEPPEKVKFFFATTEPHKIPATILSRCQCFHLNRISTEKIMSKLQWIANDLKREVDTEALRSLAGLAEGGLRDAEVLLDQVLAFQEGPLTAAVVADVLGIMPKERLFALDAAGPRGNIAVAFEIVHQLFSSGKNLNHFLDELIEHFRIHLLIKIHGNDFSATLPSEKEKYLQANAHYSQEQCLYILDLLLEAQQHLRSLPFKQIALEMLLVKILRSHHRIPLETLVDRLKQLESSLKNSHQSEKPIDSLSRCSTTVPQGTIVEDPSPKKSELPSLPESIKPHSEPSLAKKIATPSSTIKETQSEDKLLPLQRKSKHDTLMRFAAKELEGNLSLKQFKN